MLVEPASPPRGRGRDPGGLRVGTLVLLLALSLAFTAHLQVGSATLHPTARDQVHDLSLSLALRERGTLSDGNRHPLLPALLAPFARRDPAFFDAASLAAAVLGGVALLAIGLAAGRLAGAAGAVFVALTVLLELRLQARRIAPEPLLAALLALSAARVATAPAARRPVLASAVGGLTLGLAWLTKASALLSLPASLLVIGCARAPRRGGRVLGLLAGFVVAAAPLLGWNLAQGRSPVFNVNSAHVMWEDRWDTNLDETSTATAGTFLARHGWEGALARLGSGFLAQRGVEWVYGAFGSLLLLAALRRRAPPAERDAAGREARHRYVVLACATAATWLLAMAWYAPVVASRRLLFPVFPLLATAVAAAGVDAWPGLRALAPRGVAALARAAGWMRGAALPVAAALLAIAFVVPRGGERAGPRPTLDPASLEAAALLRALPAGSRVLLRPSRTHPPDWLFDDVVVPVGLPAAVFDADLSGWLARSVDAILLSEGLLRHRPSLWPGVTLGASGGLRVEPDTEGVVTTVGPYALVVLR